MADLGEVGRANVALRADLKKLKGDLDRARRQVGKAGKKTGQAFSSEFGKSSLSGFKTALAGLVSLVAIQQLGRAFLRAALPFNSALAETTTLIDGTIKQTEFLRDAARRMAKEFGGTGADQIRAFYQAISAGAGTVEEAAQLLDTANKFAIGGVTDLVTSVDALTTATNAYSRSNLTAADAADILFVGIKAGKTTAAELGGAIGKVAALAESAGVKFDELVASVAALTTTGISTREAVTGLRAILASIIKPSSEAAKLAKSLGLEFNSAALKSKGFAVFLEDLVIATGGSTEKMALLFGGVEALAPVISLTGAVADKLSDTMDDMAVRTGAADVAFEKVAKSLSQRLIKAMGSFSVASEKAGTSLLKVIVPALELIADNMVALGQLMIVLAATQIPRMVGALKLLTVSLLTAGRASRLLGGPLGLLVAAAAALGVAFSRMSDSAKNLEENFDRLDAAIFDVERAMGDLKKVEGALVGDTDRLKLANERLAEAIQAGGVAAIGAAASEVEAIRKRLQANESLRLKYVAVLKAQTLALKAEQQLATTAFREEFTPDDSASVGGFARRANIGRSAANRIDFSREAIAARRVAALEAVRVAAQKAAEQGKATDEQLRFLKADAALAERRLQVEELGAAIEGLATTVATTPTTTTTTTTLPTTSVSTADVDTGLDDLKGRIDAEVRLREEIGATIATLGEEEIVRERLLSQIELDRIGRQLDTAAIEATTQAQRNEIASAQDLLTELRLLTDWRIQDESALHDQQDAMADAIAMERAFADAIQATGRQLVSAAFAGEGFLEILVQLALRLVEIIAIQQLVPAGGGSGGGLLGILAGVAVNAIGAAAGAGFTGASNIGSSQNIGLATTGASLSGSGIFTSSGSIVLPMAHGGMAPLNQFALVGEEGPEIVRFGAQARVFSNDDLRDALSGGAANSEARPVNVTMNITTRDVGSFRRSQAQVSAELGRMIQQGQSRQN